MNESAGVGTLAGMESVGARIIAVRKAQGLTQQEFADRMKAAGTAVTRGAVGNWELDKGIGRDNLMAVAREFGVSLSRAKKKARLSFSACNGVKGVLSFLLSEPRWEKR